MELKEVLLIEDRPATVSSVEDSLMPKGIVVNVAKDDVEMIERFIRNPGIQIVILDWLLDSDTSVIAKLCLQKLRENWFVPVVVWTQEIARYEAESDEVYKIFPSPCISEYSKSEVKADDLLGILTDWHSTPPMSIFGGFKRSATRAINQSFYDLAAHSADDLTKGLKSIFALDEDQKEIDTEHPIDVFTRMISRILYSDKEFIPELSDFLSTLDLAEELSAADKKRKSAIQNYHMYYLPRDGDPRIRSGDIVELSYNIDDDHVTQKAIVITPACDLAIPGKTDILRLLSIYPDERPKDTKAESEWPFLEDGEPQIVSFHDIVVLRNESYKDDNLRKAVMSYEHEYQIAVKIVVEIRRLKRLDDPYRADLIHRFTSHAGRIGVPEFNAT